MMSPSNEDADLDVYPLHSQVEVSPDYICTVFYPSLGDIMGRQRPLPLTQGFAPSPTLHSSGRQLASGQQSAPH